MVGEGTEDEGKEDFFLSQMLVKLFGLDGPHSPNVFRLLEASNGSAVGVRIAMLLILLLALIRQAG